MGNLSILRGALASAQVSTYTTGAITLPSRGLLAVPNAPTIGTATGGAGSASVTFTASATGATATSFIATSSPSGITGTSATSPITVSGLTNGTAYTFTVAGINASGTGAPSAASNSITPVAPAWEQIATVSPTSTNLVTFSSIPAGYSALKIIGQSNTAGDSILYTRMNSATTGYAEYGYYGSPSSTLSTAGSGLSSSVIRRYASNATASSENAPVMGTYFNANDTSGAKQVQITSGYSSPTNLAFTISQGSLISQNAKITEIQLGTGNGPGAGNYAANARLTLYGLKVS